MIQFMELSCLFKGHILDALIGTECKCPLSPRLYGDSFLRSVALYAQVCESVRVTAERIALTSVLQQVVGFLCRSLPFHPHIVLFVQP
jgi:hypothetical protein